MEMKTKIYLKGIPFLWFIVVTVGGCKQSEEMQGLCPCISGEVPGSCSSHKILNIIAATVMGMLTYLAKGENALMARMADGAVLIRMLVTTEINTMESLSPQLPVKLEQNLIGPVFAMEKQIILVLSEQ